ncbi:MAG: NUDIX domain-containing protein [Opitutales bacterium]|nr:NUDIX domain-containing protein [Opitutales bacterium]
MFPKQKSTHFARSSNNNPIRPAVRAILQKDGKILLVKLKDNAGGFFVLPGGGQKHGETMFEALRRECAEELGIAVKPGRLCYVREYIGANHEFVQRHKYFHQVEIVFECDLLDDSQIGSGTEEDLRQVGFAWVPIADLPRTNIRPSVFKDFVKDGKLEIPYGAYLGDTN